MCFISRSPTNSAQIREHWKVLFLTRKAKQPHHLLLCQNAPLLFLSTCYENTQPVLWRKILFHFAGLDTTLDRGFRTFSIRAHTKTNPFCLQLRVPVLCKSVSVFLQSPGTLIFLPAFSPQTSSHAVRGYHCTCLRKKKKIKKNIILICAEPRYILLIAWGLQRTLHTSGYFWVSKFSILMVESVQTYAPVLLYCVCFCFLLGL